MVDKSVAFVCGFLYTQSKVWERSDRVLEMAGSELIRKLWADNLDGSFILLCRVYGLDEKAIREMANPFLGKDLEI